MNVKCEQPDPSPEVIGELRDLAKRGTSVREIVQLLQTRFGIEDLLPVLWCFMKAFCLPLGAVLPMREWLGTDRDQEIDAIILPAIEGARCRWASSEEDRDGAAQSDFRIHGLLTTENRS